MITIYNPTYIHNLLMKTKIEKLINEWEQKLVKFKEELSEKIEDDDYDAHDVDNLEGHIERLESDIIALRGLL